MYMDEGLDTGDIIMKEMTVIGDKTASELYGELSATGARLITAAIDSISKGDFIRTAQDERLATYAHMLRKSDGAVDFACSPERIVRLVRGTSAYTHYRGETMKIWEAFSLNKENQHKAGTITDVSDKGLEISAGNMTLRITEIQMPGKKRVQIKDYLKGNTIEKFAVLG
jgi:methionyl-tRNA formyltransferase